MSHRHLLRGQAPPGKDGSRQTHVRKPAVPAVRARTLMLSPVLIIATLGIGWLVWSGLEWRDGRTPSYRREGLRVVRRADGHPAGFFRSLVRELCILVLLVPTIVVCAMIAFAFVMGASPPEGLWRQPRSAPWDVLTRTKVIDELGQARGRTKLKLGDDWPTDPSPVMLRRSGEKWRQN